MAKTPTVYYRVAAQDGGDYRWRFRYVVIQGSITERMDGIVDLTLCPNSLHKLEIEFAGDSVVGWYADRPEEAKEQKAACYFTHARRTPCTLED